MQRSWRTDVDKLTFITCLPPVGERAEVTAEENAAAAKMIGDINLFLSADDNEGGRERDSNPLIGEIELMITTKENQGRGYGRASLVAFLQYIYTHEKGILGEYDQERRGSPGYAPSSLAHLRVKIAESNVRSIRLFESVGFRKVSAEANYFGEVELRLVEPLSATLISLRKKYGDAGYREIRYGWGVI